MNTMQRQKLLLAAAFLIPLLGNMLAVCVWLPLLNLPPGARIRPMLQCLQEFAIAFATLAAGAPAGISFLTKGRLVVGGLCLGFSTMPFFLGTLASWLICYINDLQWAD